LDDDEHAVALAMRPTAASRTPIRLQGDRIDYIPSAPVMAGQRSSR
jgi:hypothetical protein